MHFVVSYKNQRVLYTYKRSNRKWKKTWMILLAPNDFAHDSNICVYIHSCHLSQKFAAIGSCWDHVCRIIPELNDPRIMPICPFFNCAVIWFIKWTCKIWGFLEGLVKQRFKVRANVRIDNVRTFGSTTQKELYYFTISKHLSKQGLLVATEIQIIVILNYIEYPLNFSICYCLIY